MPLTDRVVLAGLAGGIVLAGFAAWLLVSGPMELLPAGDASGSAALVAAASPTIPVESAEARVGGEIVVDVEGAVAAPGIRRLPGDSRIADAIAAAGGYARDADLAASAHALNLAEPLTDGDQVYVPRLGEAVAGGGGDGGSSTSTGSGGLVDLNHASSEELDALPGIGPATIAKILAARAEQPFKTLDELLERKVLTSAQLTGIRDRVTV